MNPFKILTGAAFAVVLTVGLPQTAPVSLDSGEAQAAVDVSINIGTFYDRMSPYGDWTRRGNTYVFVPAVGAGWRPYTQGHWEYTDSYGWIWISDEPFGWAAYHYGRWGYDDEIGWYWVPATQWAPAWVSWRRSDNYVAWAPLPPDQDSGFAVNIDINSDRYADRYWAAVPAPRFLDRNVGSVVVRQGDTRFKVVFRDTKPLGRVEVRNKIVINNIIKVTDIERVTRKKVEVKRVRNVNDAGQAGDKGNDGGSVNVFAPNVDKTGNASPKNVKTVEDVARKHKNKSSTSTNQPALGQSTGNAATGQGSQDQNAQGQPGNTVQMPAKKKQKLKQNQGDNTGDMSVKKNQKLQQGEDNSGTVVTKKKNQQIQQGQDDGSGQVLKQKRNEKKQLQQNQPGEQPASQDQTGNQKRKTKKNCMPGTDNCPPAN
jgi:hypothetical protein